MVRTLEEIMASACRHRASFVFTTCLMVAMAQFHPSAFGSEWGAWSVSGGNNPNNLILDRVYEDGVTANVWSSSRTPLRMAGSCSIPR
jgi:hypothetical protein